MKIVKSTYRYLLYNLALFIKWVVKFMPRKPALFLGAAGGGLCFVLLRKQRRRSIENLSKAFGNNQNNYFIAKSVFRNLGMNFIEWLQMSSLNKKKINDIVKITGVEKIDKALENGKGAIIITSHFGNWEYISAFLVLNGYKGSVVAREIYYSLYNKLLVDMRNSVGVKTLYRNGSVRGLIKVLRNNGLLGILPDQDTDKVEGVFVNFFGRPAYTPTGPVSLALATGANLIPCFIRREGRRHHIYVEEPMALTVLDNKAETIKINTERMSAVAESYIRKYPEQWVWMHNRWKTKDEKSNIKNTN